MKHIESGHRMPSIEVLYRLVQVLHLSLDELWLSASSHLANTESDLLLLLSHCSETDLQIISDLTKSLIKNKS